MRDIADSIDLAVVAVPAEHSIAVVKECAQKGVRAIILIPGGFSETRKDKTLEQEILSITRQHGIRVIGPNCVGSADALRGALGFQFQNVTADTRVPARSDPKRHF